jgi:hypothetical protein
MNKTDCKLERVSNVSVGFILMVIGVVFTIIGTLVLPVIGLLLAITLLIFSGIFLASPRSKACSIIAEKARGAINK